jgi:hypothetical protein
MNPKRRPLCKTQARQADARLEALVVEGLKSGEEIPLAQQFWTELRRDAAENPCQSEAAQRSAREKVKAFVRTRSKGH